MKFFVFAKITDIFLRSSRSDVFLVEGVLKICSKFTGEHPCRNVISIKLQSNFIEITLRHGCSPVNLLHIFRIPFSKNTSGGLLLDIYGKKVENGSRERDTRKNLIGSYSIFW